MYVIHDPVPTIHEKSTYFEITYKDLIESALSRSDFTTKNKDLLSIFVEKFGSGPHSDIDNLSVSKWTNYRYQFFLDYDEFKTLCLRLPQTKFSMPSITAAGEKCAGTREELLKHQLDYALSVVVRHAFTTKQAMDNK